MLIKLVIFSICSCLLITPVLSQNILTKQSINESVSICELAENPPKYLNKEIEIEGLFRIAVFPNTTSDNSIRTPGCNRVIIISFLKDKNEKNYEILKRKIMKHPGRIYKVSFLGVLQETPNDGHVRVIGKDYKESLKTHTMLIKKLLFSKRVKDISILYQ